MFPIVMRDISLKNRTDATTRKLREKTQGHGLGGRDPRNYYIPASAD